jgi:hypothetical protein
MKLIYLRSIAMVVCLILPGAILAQTAITPVGGMLHSSLVGTQIWMEQPVPDRFTQPLLENGLLQIDSSLQYFEPSAPRHAWPIEGNWGSFVMFGLGERITLSSDSGYLDSVTFLFNGVADTVHVLLVSDTLFPTTAGTFHLMNGFDQSAAIYGSAIIVPKNNGTDSTITVQFPHVLVPKEFHVLVAPSINSVTVPQFNLISDSEATRTRTVDNSRSNFIGIVTSSRQLFVALVDSTLVPAGDLLPLFSNLYITAYVSENPAGATNETQYIGLIPALEESLSSGVTEDPLSSQNISVFPNPASTTIQLSIPNSVGSVQVEIIDLLGRPVLSAQIDGEGKLDINRIQAGRYEAVIHTTNGLITMPLLIQR